MAEPRKPQVSLRGSSAKEITRDALLQQVSHEREIRNYTRRAAAAALCIQKVWRRYIITKKAALQVREEWETLFSCDNVFITNTWVTSSLLRPFLFFITRPSIVHKKLQTRNIKCMLTCFRILLESINSTESQKNFCSLAMGTLEERSLWLHQSRKLISVCLFVLTECDCNSPRGQATVSLTSQAMRLAVVLTDLKGWKTVDAENLRDAHVAIKNLVKSIVIGDHGLYSCIRRYIIKLDSHVILQRTSGVPTDDRFFITASAITLAVRPFQVANRGTDDSVSVDVQNAVEQYCVFLLTVPWLVQRLPAILVPALKHKSILSPCLKILQVLKEKLFMAMSKSEESQISDFSSEQQIPRVGWVLANIINLATQCESGSLDSGQFSQGINFTDYVQVVNIVADKLLACLESGGRARKDSEYLDNPNDFTETMNNVNRERETPFGSLQLSYTDLFRPIYQQWHLLPLLAMMKKDASIPWTDTLQTNASLENLGKLRFSDIALFYSYMLRLLPLVNPIGGSLPILNMLSFTPGFLLDLWGALESFIFLGSGQVSADDKPSTSGTSNSQIKGSYENKQKRTSKDVGNKWVNVLQKLTGKSPTDAEYNPENVQSSVSHVKEDASDLWDIEPFKRGPHGISKDISCMLHLFCATYSHLLLVLDDIEFYEKQVPFTLEQQKKITAALNTLVYNGISHGNSQQSTPLLDAAVRCLHLLYERDCRRQFCPPLLWLSPARKSRPPIAAAARAHEAVSVNLRSGDDSTIPTIGSVITVIPHVFPFEERVQMFREFIKLDKVSRRMAGEVAGPGPGSIEIVIRRGHIVEDGFKQLNSLGSKLKSSIHVSFVSECGLPEAGLDYGGLSKEFLTDISKKAFDPAYGLFIQTSTSERLLIPNTSARLLENGIQMIEFLGRVVGKALYEGILLDYSFSHVFVQKLLGRYSFLDELSTLDPELYRNLMYVKNYDGDVKELSLDFTVTEELLGKLVVIELKTGGKDIGVTSENKLQYVHAMADYKLNRQVLPLANAFYRGLADLISPSWLSLFSAGEFNQLLSGGNHDIDVGDLRNNTRYTGGYTDGSRTVKIFWEVIATFEPNERCMLLKFVTSCSRAPLLGFKHLQPAFTIHKVACDVPLWVTLGGQDVDRLPSASTCYNTLKLPAYRRGSTLRAKLLYAINSNAGFELS